MAAAVAEMEADIKQLKSEIESWPARARFKAKRAGLQRDVENLQAAIKTIDSLYGGPEPDNDPPVKYLNGATALMVAAALPEPLTALALAGGGVQHPRHPKAEAVGDGWLGAQGEARPLRPHG